MPPLLKSDRPRHLVRAAIALALLLAIVWVIDVGSVADAFRGANAAWILVAAALLPANLLLESEKWRLFLDAVDARTSRWNTLASILAGYALGAVTPLRVGDHAGRILYLADRRKGLLLMLSLLDRLYSIWVYAVAGTLAMSYLVLHTFDSPASAWWLTIALGSLIIIGAGVFVFKPSLLSAATRGLSGTSVVGRWVRRIEWIDRLMPSITLRALILSGLRFAIFTTQFVLLLVAFDASASITNLYIGSVLVFFVKTVIPSISLFDLGIRESAAVLFFGFFGVLPGAAFGASLLLFGINIVLPAIVGAPFVPKIHLQWKARRARAASRIEAETG